MASQKANFNLTLSVSAVLLLGVVFFLNGLLGRVKLGRFDLTEDKIYTMSDAAKRVLSGLDVPVQVKIYMTSKDGLPVELQNLERDLKDKLAEFRAASGGNLSFAVYDPSNDDELAEKLGAKGIRPFQVSSYGQDQIDIKLIYSTLGIAYKDKEEELIPGFMPQNLATLEYDICSRILKLTRDSNPVVAVYASKQAMDPQIMQLYLQMGQQPPAPQEIYTQVEQLLTSQNYDVRKVELTADSTIPDEATTLVVLAPRDLDARQRYEINRFLQRGGNVVLAAQRYEFTYNSGRRGGFDISAVQLTLGVDDLLESYGVALSDAIFMDSNMEILSVPSTRNLGGLQVQVQEPVQTPTQIRVGEGQFNEDLSVTNQVAQILFLWGSRLEIDDEKMAANDLTATTLFESSDQSWEADFTPGPLTQAMFQPNPDRDVSRSTLGVLVEGDLPNPFSEGAIPRWSAAADSVDPGPVEVFEPADSSLLVIGCSKMFDDSVLGAASNQTLLLNSVDALTLGDDLIEMRGKATALRALEQVGDNEKLFYRFLTIGLVPIVVAVIGIVRSMRRRREAATYWAANAS